MLCYRRTDVFTSNMEVKCKPRSRNFTEFEKNLLFEIVTNNYSDIIENKKTDGVSCAKKQCAWEDITSSFNSRAQTGPRTSKQLHSLYDMLKRNARANLHSDKKNLYKTGGGTFIPKSSILDEKIVASLKPQFEPLKNAFDSSSDYYANANHEGLCVEDETEYVIEEPCTSHLQENLTMVQTGPPSSSTVESDLLQTPQKEPLLKRKKREIPQVQNSNKKKSLNVIANRIFSRKNLKDEIDKEVKDAKLKVLHKELEAANQKIEQQQKLFELELSIKKKELKELKLKKFSL